jgi:hypothetical protein
MASAFALGATDLCSAGGGASPAGMRVTARFVAAMRNQSA